LSKHNLFKDRVCNNKCFYDIHESFKKIGCLDTVAETLHQKLEKEPTVIITEADAEKMITVKALVDILINFQEKFPFEINIIVLLS